MPFTNKEFGPDNPRAWSANHPELDAQRQGFVVGGDGASHESHGVLRAHRATQFFGQKLMDLLKISPDRLMAQINGGLNQEGVALGLGVPIEGERIESETTIVRAKFVQKGDEIVAHKSKVDDIKWQGGDPSFYLNNGMVVSYRPIDEVIVRRA